MWWWLRDVCRHIILLTSASCHDSIILQSNKKSSSLVCFCNKVKTLVLWQSCTRPRSSHYTEAAPGELPTTDMNLTIFIIVKTPSVSYNLHNMQQYWVYNYAGIDVDNLFSYLLQCSSHVWVSLVQMTARFFLGCQI